MTEQSKSVTPEMMIACVRRELALRQRAYPRFLANGKMKQAEADKELAAMQAVHDAISKIPELVKALRGQVILTVFQLGLHGEKPVGQECELCGATWLPDGPEVHKPECVLT